ncbi:MAG: peptidoglycan-binding domain-containing protein [Pseudomonadota bacterium]
MRHINKPSIALFAVLASSISLQPVWAQSNPADEIRQRIQKEIQSIVDEKAAEALTQIEQQLSVAPPTAELINTSRVQTALNFFKFHAGPVDGIAGMRTRSATKAFQNYMGYPVSGMLNDGEAEFLLKSYQMARANEDETGKIASRHPDGIKGVLIVFRGETTEAEMALGSNGVSSEQTAAVEASDPDVTSKIKRVQVAESDAEPETLAAFCALQKNPNTAAGLKKSRQSEVRLSMASGPIFCDAKEAAIAQSESLIANIAGFTTQEVEKQCYSFEPALVSLVEKLPSEAPSDVLQATSDFIERTELAEDGLKGIAQVCLGVGYKSDRVNLAVGSALILAAMEYLAYAEFPEHHLALGFGIEKDTKLAKQWFDLVMQYEPDYDSDYDAQAAERLKKLQEAMSKLEAVAEIDGGVLPLFSLD